MKRIKTILLLLFICLLPLSLVFGQEKKNEQKVKVVIADKSGTKVIIDTTFTGMCNIDSIVAKGGNVIYIGKDDQDLPDSPGRHLKVIARVDKDGEDTEHQYVYINDGKVLRHSHSDTFDVYVSDDEFDDNTDVTKYVIAKNGVTVTIEGNDEAKIKELTEEIKKKLDVNNNEEAEKSVIEVEKKIVKKR